MHRLIAPFRMRPLLAVACLLSASALFVPSPATSQPVEATPHVQAETVGDDSVEVSLAGPSAVKAGDFVIVAIASATEGAELTFGYTPDPGAAKRAVFEEPGTGRRLIVFIQPPEGKYRVSLLGQIAKEGKDPAAFAVHDVTVGKVTPEPGPGPDPEPEPDPEPTPDTVGPIFGVLLYDTEDDDTISREQLLTLNSAAFDQYLDAKGLKVNGHPQFRVWDDDKITEASLAEESDVLRKAYAEAKSKYRGRAYLVLSNGTTGYSGELPETEEGIFETFKKYGG